VTSAGPATRYPGGPRESPGFLLWRLTRSWERAVGDALAPLGLTHTQFVLLACTHWLHSHGRPTGQVDISAASGVDTKTASAVIRRLEADGLVTRVPSPTDTRVRVVVPTAAGAGLAGRAIGVVEQADETFFATQPAALRAVLLDTAAAHAR